MIRLDHVTNSSSAHHIIDTSKESDVKHYEKVLPDEDGNIVLNGGEFGWEQEDYYYFQEKASYMAIYAVDWAGKNSEKFTEILKNVIKEETGAKDVIFNFTTDYGEYSDGSYNYGYIDHQSVESHNYDYLFETPDMLRAFIFGKSVCLVTDNDNN
jgi:DUF4097 and DUF4098 domain-containing protein YvlB